jgi:metal-responsive CopG/Arc/MetJ family transcriptional regulator
MKEAGPSKMFMRTHVLLPTELVKEVDRVAGSRRRSRFVEEAIREHLRREALSAALDDSAGILSDADYPEWDSPEKTSAWVAERRKEDAAALERKLGREAD